MRAALLCALAPAAAAAPDPNASASSMFFTGVELDNQDSRRFDLGLSLLSGGGTGFELLGSRSETERDVLDVSSTYAFGQLTHDFGRYGLGAGVRHARDEDLSKTLGYLGSLFLDAGSARLTVSLEHRSTDFDETPFTASGADLGLTDVTSASGVAACSVESLGYGLALRVARPSFAFYASGSAYDYSSYDCSTTLTSTTSGTTSTPTGPGRAPVRVTLPSTVTQIAAPVLTSFGGYSSTRVPREGALLESSVMLGASVALGARTTLGAELYRDSEEFAQNDTSTALAYVAFRLTPSVSVDLTAGASESDLQDNTAFAGVRLSARFGR